MPEDFPIDVLTGLVTRHTDASSAQRYKRQSLDLLRQLCVA
jgi:hypothetical protein